MASAVKKYSTKCSNVCAVRFCKTTSQVPDASLFRFPKDHKRCQEWVELCGCEYLLPIVRSLYSSMYRVCHLHFENIMFTCNEGKIKRLSSKSFPTKNLPRFQTIQSESLSSESPGESLMLQIYPTTRDADKILLVLSETDPSGLQSKSEEFQTSSCKSPDNLQQSLIESPLKNTHVGTQTPTLSGSTRPRKQKIRSKRLTLQSKVSGLKRKIDDQEANKSFVNSVTLKDFKE